MNTTTTRYYEIGSALALADIRAGHSREDPSDTDITAAAGLHEGDAEYRAIHAGDVIGYEGAEGVERAAAEVLRGYRAEAESNTQVGAPPEEPRKPKATKAKRGLSAKFPTVLSVLSDERGSLGVEDDDVQQFAQRYEMCTNGGFASFSALDEVRDARERLSAEDPGWRGLMSRVYSATTLTQNDFSPEEEEEWEENGKPTGLDPEAATLAMRYVDVLFSAYIAAGASES